MTAAAARPPLFNHLVASRPPREGGSTSATLTSVALHLGAIVALAFLTTSPASTRPAVEVINPIVAPPLSTEPTPPAAPGGTGGVLGDRGAPAPPALIMPDLPNMIRQLLPGGVNNPPIDYGPPASRLPGSGTAGGGSPAGRGDGPGFTPYTIAPQLLNRPEVGRLLQRLYPGILLNAGIGGTVVVWIQVNEAGMVVQTQVSAPSGHRQLDEAALRVAQAMKFSPAYNRDQPVQVWVELPIIFSAGR